jgi:hypothetical protein
VAAAVSGGCGGKTTGAHGPPIVAEAAEFPAVRFVPDKPTYVVAAHSVRDAQRALTDVIESFGMLAGVTSSQASHELQQLLAVDPLSAELGTTLGVDLGGGFVLFSEALDPTFVVHLAAPEAAQAFFEHVREMGIPTQSVIVDGIEINTAKVARLVQASWAIDKDWLFVHFTTKDVKPDWFVHARHPSATAWTRDFGWAKRLASQASNLVGYLDVPALIAAAKLPRDAVACMSRFDAVKLAGFAMEGDGQHVGGKLGFSLGGGAQDVARAIIAPPAGFQPLADTAPLAAQWNLDVGAVLQWIEPCTASLRIDTGELAKLGVRAGRVALAAFDPDNKTDAKGVVALDLTSKTYLAQLLDAALDKVPGHSLLTSDRTFGAFKGHRFKFPSVITLDYVLDDQHAFAGMGDGMLDKLVMGAPGTGAPIFAIDVHPPAMKPDAWRYLVAQMSNERFAKAAVERLMRWRDGHIAISLDHDTLVIDAAGNRR